MSTQNELGGTKDLFLKLLAESRRVFGPDPTVSIIRDQGETTVRIWKASEYRGCCEPGRAPRVHINAPEDAVSAAISALEALPTLRADP